MSAALFVMLFLGSAAYFSSTQTHDPDKFVLPAHPPHGPLAFVAFGDSLGAGLCAAPGKGFLALLARDLEAARPGSTFDNEARPGFRIWQVNRYMTTHAPARADAVLLEIGANDVEAGTAPRDFQRQYRIFFAQVRARYPHAPVVILGVPDIGARSALVTPVLKPLYAALTSWYDGIARHAADDHGAAFFDFYALSHTPAATASENVCPDGIHATNAGHAKLAAALEPVVRAAFQF